MVSGFVSLSLGLDAKLMRVRGVMSKAVPGREAPVVSALLAEETVPLVRSYGPIGV